MNQKLNLQVSDKKVLMENQNIKIELNEKAKATSLIFKDKELLKNSNKGNTFYCDYHMDGKAHAISPTKIKVIENSKNLIHIAYVDNRSMLGVSYHFMLKDNDTAIYSYVNAWNNHEDEFEINEFRTVYRISNELLHIGYNSERSGIQPTSEHMKEGRKIQDETYELEDGSLYTNSNIYSKYDYAGYFKENEFWGQYGKNYGFWFIPVNTGYYGCGPLNQDLLVHYDGIILNYMCSEHFGKGKFMIPKNWEKIYGPWCIYLNEGTNKINDVKNRVSYEKKLWPYSWVNEKNYNRKTTTVKGNITINKNKPNNKFIIVLSSGKTNSNELIKQKDGYTFYSETNENGEFIIKDVKPDIYTAHIYSNGGDFIDTHTLSNIYVDDEHEKNIGTININAQEKRIIWQIGESTRTTEGFKFSSQLRNYIWKDLVPNNLIYTVGQSNKDDWYYLQSDNGAWKIQFNSDLIKNYDNLKLSIALAGATQKNMLNDTGASISIYLNDKRIKNKNLSNDRASYRSSLRSGAYHLVETKIYKDDINKGINEFLIKTDGYLMYDTIILSE